MSERRSCAVLRFDRKTHRYRSVRGDQAPLRNRIKEIAAVRVRYGYRRIHVLLRRKRCFGGTLRDVVAGADVSEWTTPALRPHWTPTLEWL